jgi:dihydroorotate dehydrogenase
VSSPNTPGLRDLQGQGFLQGLLAQLQEENRKAAEELGSRPLPLLLKVAPDLSLDDLDTVLEAALDNEISGIIATNTTLGRDGLDDPKQSESGGLSGRPLAARATEIVRHISAVTDARLPIIGVGGIFTAEDVQEKLDAGASLVQIYTALAYEGPGLPGRILRRLAR